MSYRNREFAQEVNISVKPAFNVMTNSSGLKLVAARLRAQFCSILVQDILLKIATNVIDPAPFLPHMAPCDDSFLFPMVNYYFVEGELSRLRTRK